MSMCRVFLCVVGRECLLWSVRSLGKTLLAFALLHSVLHGQICLLLQVFLDFLLLPSRSGLDLTEAEDIKKRWQEYTEELHRKKLHNPHNHDGVITHLEPDILECEVKWALESKTRTKVMEFQLSYFKSWKMMLWKCCTQYASKYGELSSGHRTGKRQLSF